MYFPYVFVVMKKMGFFCKKVIFVKRGRGLIAPDDPPSFTSSQGMLYLLNQNYRLYSLNQLSSLLKLIKPAKV